MPPTADDDTLEPLFPISDPARTAKGRRWLRALQRQVADVWQATTETDTSLCRVHGMETESEVVAISAAFAVTATRVLDLEVFQREHSDKYEHKRDEDPDGRVVTALLLVRNAEIHLPVVLDPAIGEVLSLLHGTRSVYRVIPAWRAYSDLPAEVQENRRSKERGKSTRVAAHAAYKDRLEGNLVIETLLDAIHWFLRCDPRLASRTVDGELEFFPLPDLFQHRYERRHPEWPDRHEVERDILRSAVEKLPGGLGRSISHRLLDGSGERVEAYVGQTALGQGASTLFLESPDQVALDVAAGYEYRLESGAPITCGPSGSDLFVGERLLCDFSFREMDAEDEDRWRSLWHQRSRFPDLYLRDRHPG